MSGMYFYQFKSVRRQFHGGSRALRAVPYRVTVLATVKCHSEHDDSELPTTVTAEVHARAVSSSETEQKNSLIMLTPLLESDAYLQIFVTVKKIKGVTQNKKPRAEHN
jgi:hypothetical protein